MKARPPAEDMISDHISEWETLSEPFLGSCTMVYRLSTPALTASTLSSTRNCFKKDSKFPCVRAGPTWSRLESMDAPFFAGWNEGAIPGLLMTPSRATNSDLPW